MSGYKQLVGGPFCELTASGTRVPLALLNYVPCDVCFLFLEDRVATGGVPLGVGSYMSMANTTLPVYIFPFASVLRLIILTTPSTPPHLLLGFRTNI